MRIKAGEHPDALHVSARDPETGEEIRHVQWANTATGELGVYASAVDPYSDEVLIVRRPFVLIDTRTGEEYQPQADAQREDG